MKSNTGKYWLHNKRGDNLHFQTNDLTEAIKEADSREYNAKVSILENGQSALNGKSCKVFREVYNNNK